MSQSFEHQKSVHRMVLDALKPAERKFTVTIACGDVSLEFEYDTEMDFKRGLSGVASAIARAGWDRSIAVAKAAMKGGSCGT
jgi:hypothetical protein